MAWLGRNSVGAPPNTNVKFLPAIRVLFCCKQAAEVAESRGWAAELQRQGKEHRSKQVASRAKAAAAVEDLKVLHLVPE